MKSDLWKSTTVESTTVEWIWREMLGTMMVQSTVNFKGSWISARIRNSKPLGIRKNCYTLKIGLLLASYLFHNNLSNTQFLWERILSYKI